MGEDAGGELRRLEEELFRPEVRRDGARLRALLHEDFHEFGSSGRVFTREQVVQELAGETTPQLALQEFRAERLEGETWLVTYRSVRRERGQEAVESRRCSIWQRRGGHWEMRFHQGTKLAAADSLGG